MRVDLYTRMVLTAIAAALLYLCIILTPLPVASAQTAQRPGMPTGPAEVVILLAPAAARAGGRAGHRQRAAESDGRCPRHRERADAAGGPRVRSRRARWLGGARLAEQQLDRSIRSSLARRIRSGLPVNALPLR